MIAPCSYAIESFAYPYHICTIVTDYVDEYEDEESESTGLCIDKLKEMTKTLQTIYRYVIEAFIASQKDRHEMYQEGMVILPNTTILIEREKWSSLSRLVQDIYRKGLCGFSYYFISLRSSVPPSALKTKYPRIQKVEHRLQLFGFQARNPHITVAYCDDGRQVDRQLIDEALVFEWNQSQIIKFETHNEAYPRLLQQAEVIGGLVPHKNVNRFDGIIYDVRHQCFGLVFQKVEGISFGGSWGTPLRNTSELLAFEEQAATFLETSKRDVALVVAQVQKHFASQHFAHFDLALRNIMFVPKDSSIVLIDYAYHLAYVSQVDQIVIRQAYGRLFGSLLKEGEQKCMSSASMSVYSWDHIIDDLVVDQ